MAAWFRSLMLFQFKEEITGSSDRRTPGKTGGIWAQVTLTPLLKAQLSPKRLVQLLVGIVCLCPAGMTAMHVAILVCDVPLSPPESLQSELSFLQSLSQELQLSLLPGFLTPCVNKSSLFLSLVSRP